MAKQHQSLLIVKSFVLNARGKYVLHVSNGICWWY